MRLGRLLMLGALSAATAIAPAAHSASATTACRLLLDAPGDAQLVPGGPNIASLDIQSADIATGPNNLVGVLRLASLAQDPQTLGGSHYSLSWSSNKYTQTFSLVRYVDGSEAVDYTYKKDGDTGQGTSVPATASVDTSTGTITWTLPRAQSPVLKAQKKLYSMKLTGLSAAAAPGVNTKTVFTFSGSFNGDSAAGGKAYIDGSRSCVKGT